MRIATLLSVIGLGSALVAGGVFLTPSFADDKSASRSGERPWLSIPQLAAKLDVAGYRNIEKIEREHGGYEVRATSRDGKRVKLYLDPRTGSINERQSHGSRHDYDAMRGESDGKRNTADCSERRCRDDLPQTGAVTPTARN